MACVPIDAFRTLAARPGVYRALHLADAVDAAVLQEWVVNLTRRASVPRTAHLVLELEARLSSSGFSTSGGFELPLTQAVLGDALGLSSVHLNRTIRRLREEELMDFRCGKVTILERPRLVRIAELDPRYVSLTEPKFDLDNHIFV